MSHEDTVIKMMTVAAENILRDDSDGNLNLLVFHVAVGSYVAERFRPRNMNHQVPILAEKLIHTPLDTFSSSMINAIATKKYEQINIFQRIILIDPEFDKEEYAPVEGNILPANIIAVLESFLPTDVNKDYTIADNLISISHLFEIVPDEYVQINVHTEFEIYPYPVNSSLLHRIEVAHPILSTFFPNTLVVYFDMSGRQYEECPLIVHYRNPAIYALMSDCMIDFTDLITAPFLVANIPDEEDKPSFAWYCIPEFSKVDKMKFAVGENPNLIMFAKRFYDYFYRENLIPLFMHLLQYVRGNIAFHPALGTQFELESIPLQTNSMDDYLDMYLIPFINYRLGKQHPNHAMVGWYLNHFRDVRRNRRAMLLIMESELCPIKMHGEVTLLKFIQAEMEYLSSLNQQST
jgi:hypothetical protein